MDDVLTLQVVQCQRHLTEVEFDSVLTKLDVLLQVVPQVSSQKEIHHHEHVLLILERVPGTRKGGLRAQSLSSLKRINMPYKQRLSTQTTHTASHLA